MLQDFMEKLFGLIMGVFFVFCVVVICGLVYKAITEGPMDARDKIETVRIEGHQYHVYEDPGFGGGNIVHSENCDHESHDQPAAH